MNNLKSYTEYAVSTPTTDFVIGFDFNYGTDAVNVTVGGVPATEAGYSVIYLNSTTMRLSPAVPSGVVRLQRETDIDVPDNQFTAGAKFIASNMDENFTQIRHAQQEVRAGFSKLSEDTYEIIDTLQVVGQAAQDAADAAEQAAQTANDAAAQVNDKVSYQDLDNAVELAVAPVQEYTALPFEEGKSYQLHSRVLLDNGYIVKNTIADNTINPNIDMTGWVNAEADQLAFNTMISTQVDDLESYIVYAETYGTSLNAAMTAINTAFIGKRVRIHVPSDFPVTATVNLDIDCDLDLSTLKVQNDIDVIFEPKIGWSGSTTPCVIDVNYKSCRLGWSMKKALGEVSIDRCTFKNIGNQALNTSAEYWFGFFISTVDIKKLDLFYPTTINSYVKPNTVVGDNAGVNRNILIEGVFTASSFASNINIYNHTAVDLYTSEDADSLCINTGSSSVLNSMHNIDIYDGFCQNVQKRMYKLMLRQKCKGIRLHGTSIAIAGGDKPYCAMDLYGDGDLVAEGAIYGTGWMIGINSSESTNFMGSTYKANFVMTKAVVDGNQVRALNQTGATASTVELLELSGSGGTELFVTQTTHTLKIGTAKHDTWSRTASMTGQCTIDKFDITMVNPLETVARAPHLVAMGNNIKIKNVTFNSTVTEDQQFLFQTLGFSNIEIEGVTVANGLSGAVMRMVTANNIKLSKVKAPTVAAIARCESGGSNLLLNLCTTPISGVTVQQVHSVNPMTNVVELNKLTF